MVRRCGIPAGSGEGAGLSRAGLGWCAFAQGFKQLDQRLDGPVAMPELVVEEPVVDASARVAAHFLGRDAPRSSLSVAAASVAGNVSACPAPADLGDVHDQMCEGSPKPCRAGSRGPQR